MFGGLKIHLLPTEINAGYFNLQSLPSAQGNLRPLPMQFQPLRIENEEVALQRGKRNHALDDELGQLHDEARGAHFLDQRRKRGAPRGVGLAVEVFELLESN